MVIKETRTFTKQVDRLLDPESYRLLQLRLVNDWAMKDEAILMLLVYPKKVQDDLSADQRKMLAALIKEEFK